MKLNAIITNENYKSVSKSSNEELSITIRNEQRRKIAEMVIFPSGEIVINYTPEASVSAFKSRLN
jgi:hypothetical protein